MDEGGEEGKVTTLFLFLHAQLPSLASWWGSVNTEIKVLSVENPELRNVLPLSLKPVAGKNIATYAWPTAKNVFLVGISACPFHSPYSFLSRSSPYFVTAYDLAWPTE